VAVVGIGCFIKAVRLLQHYNPELREKIVFTVGIICGGLKSKFFGEYLAAKAGVQNNEFTQPQFRIKDYESTAGDYSFGCIDNKGTERQIKMRTVGDMWGTGMFKCNACDFCDDVTTELADISLGDAWLPPYNQDGKGTNVIVTRSALAEKLINNGIQTDKLKVQPMAFETFLSSQQGSFNHRHKALKYRIHKAEKQGALIPPKRHNNEDISFDFKWVQYYRRNVRKNSLLFWTEISNHRSFEENMKKSLKILQRVTSLYHYKTTLFNKLWLK
jgi:coenzyme F420-reducing hydrogenase beta subunit